MSEIRILALHGFSGTFGCAAGVDAMSCLEVELRSRGLDVHVITPCAPNAVLDGNGVAWLAGNQKPLGKVVGFSITDQIVADEGPDSTTPKPLLADDLPTLSPEDDAWDGVTGFEDSLDFLEGEWSASPFDGILGFSQGGMMAAMLCEHLRCTRPDLVQPRFVICCGSFMRPWPLAAQSWWPPGKAFSTPSLHVMGKHDTVVAGCRSEELKRLFSTPEDYYHDLIGHPRAHGGHVVPWAGEDGDAHFFDVLTSFLLRSCVELDA